MLPDVAVYTPPQAWRQNIAETHNNASTECSKYNTAIYDSDNYLDSYLSLNISWQDKVRNERVRELTRQDHLLTKIREHTAQTSVVGSRTTDGGWKTSKTGTQLDSRGITQDCSTAHHLVRQY